MRRRPPGRPRRVRIGRQHAQGVGRVDISPPDADRAHGLRAAPASRRTARRSPVDAATAQVTSVAALSNKRVVSGSTDSRLKVWTYRPNLNYLEQCLHTLTGHTSYARRRRPVKPHGRLLVDAARGAGGHVRRRPVERQHRVRVERPHAHDVGRFERRVPQDAARAHELSAAPTSSRTARRLLVSTTTGAGLVRRRPAERQLLHRVWVVGPHGKML